MARYLGPKVKLSRRVGVPIADIPKHTSKRQLSPPGMHGFRGRRVKDYGIRKDEKQKLRYHYNVLERQFRNYLATATRRPGNTGENLLQLLECRLDNVIRRAGFTRTIWAARQFVVHGRGRHRLQLLQRRRLPLLLHGVCWRKSVLERLWLTILRVLHLGALCPVGKLG